MSLLPNDLNGYFRILINLTYYINNSCNYLNLQLITDTSKASITNSDNQILIVDTITYIIQVLCDVSEMLFCILYYADDTTVIIKNKDISILLKTLNVELEKLLIWLKTNKLSLNAKKMLFDFS